MCILASWGVVERVSARAPDMFLEQHARTEACSLLSILHARYNLLEEVRCSVTLRTAAVN